MNRHGIGFILLVALAAPVAESQTPAYYLGFDRNNYPGDQNLQALRGTFSYVGYWLGHPPSATANTWKGKRHKLDAAGFGFLVLFNGRPYAQLKSIDRATSLGSADAQAAVGAAHRDGFPGGTVIFLDQEEGGRMLPEQKAYIYAWVDVVIASGFAAGVYCSGIANIEGSGESVVTAEDIRANAAGRKISFWIANDACPLSPGCTFPRPAPNPAWSGIHFADVWQFAQSPRRPDVTGQCVKTYNADQNCYPPGFPASSGLHIDVETATSPDPSHGRSR